jgi:4'-phosphopantetheinyl transferase
MDTERATDGRNGASSWNPSPPGGQPGHDEVWVFRGRTDYTPGEGARRILSAHERARAAQFHFDRDRNRFVNARATLRRLLGAALDCDPASVSIRVDRHGKPMLDTPGDGLQFNIAHSHHHALYALARGRRVGVDIERHERLRDAAAIAERFFSPDELAAWRALGAALRARAFVQTWARKEAFVKARGLGLRIPLASFDVSVDPDAPARLLATRPDSAECNRWCLLDLFPHPAYAAALAAEGKRWTPRRFEAKMDAFAS